MLHQGGLCGPDEECPDRVFRCRRCGYSAQTELDGCPACGADWKAIDVSHGPGCPKNLLEEAMDTPNGALVRRCFRILNAKSIGLTITLADITEEEFRVLELIEAERQGQSTNEDKDAKKGLKKPYCADCPCVDQRDSGHICRMLSASIEVDSEQHEPIGIACVEDLQICCGHK